MIRYDDCCNHRAIDCAFQLLMILMVVVAVAVMMMLIMTMMNYGSDNDFIITIMATLKLSTMLFVAAV